MIPGIINMWLVSLDIDPEKVVNDERFSLYLAEKDGVDCLRQLRKILSQQGMFEQLKKISKPEVELEFILIVRG